MNRLKDMREDKDLKQKNIADAIGVSRRNYGFYETGDINIPLDILNKLADYYNTSIDYILCRTDERKPYKKSILLEKEVIKTKIK